MTNFEQIKNMSVEEMTRFLINTKSGTDLTFGEYVYFDYTIFSTTRQIINWLNSESDVSNE